MDGKVIERKIRNYSYYKYMLQVQKTKLESVTIKTTPTYGNLTGTSGGGYNSKVENVGNRRHELQLKVDELQRKVNEVERFINKSGLDDREKALMWWISNNGKLQAYARREHIGRDNVYKIRDRAIKKIAAKHKNT